MDASQKYRSIMVLILTTFFSGLFLLFPNGLLFSQETPIFSEAPIFFDRGKRMSNMVYVKFSERIIDLPKGVRKAKPSDIHPAFPAVKQKLQQLQTDFAAYALYKAIPSAVWGDVVRKHRRTGELVTINDMSQLFIMSFSEWVAIDDVIAALKQLDEVEYAHGPIQAVSTASPDDPKYQAGEQWNLAKIEAPKGWDITKGREEVVVGIIESEGVRRNHPDFTNADNSSQFIEGKGDTTFTGDHGTQTAAIVGAATDNTEGIASLGWNIKMIPYHWTGFSGGSPGNLPAKIDTAVTDSVDVLNLSFKTTGTCFDDTLCSVTRNYFSVSQAIDNAVTQGVVVVAAAGNKSINQGSRCGGNPDCDPFPYTPFPASYDEVIGVSATDDNDVFVSGYNYGSWVDLAAPGVSIPTTLGSSGYTTATGTSVAAPHVAALAGLILSVNQGLSDDQVANIMQTTAKDLGASGNDDFYGYGRINAYKAVKEAIPTKITTDITSNTTWDTHVLVRKPSSGVDLYVDAVTLNIEAGAVVVVEKQVRLNASNGGTINLEPGARVCLEPQAEIVAEDNSYVNDNGANICFHGNQACLATNGGTLKFDSGLTRTVDNGGYIAGFASGGAIEFGDNAELVLEDGALFKVEQGTTLKLGNNVDITVASDAKATIEGTASQPVTFTSLDGTPNRGDWGTVTLAGDSNTVEYTTIKGGDWGLKFYGNPSASSGNVVKNCTCAKTTRGRDRTCSRNI